MNNNKKELLTIVLLSIIIAILLTIIILLLTNKININSNKNNNIQTKLVDNLNCTNSETAFNNITVKVNQKIDNMVCYANQFTINGIDILKSNRSGIDSYEFFDNNVIILSSNTSGTSFTIFNAKSNSTIFSSDTSDVLNGYFVKSYSTNNNIITLNTTGCGPQCGKDNLGEDATFEIEYINGSFSQPKLIHN